MTMKKNYKLLRTLAVIAAIVSTYSVFASNDASVVKVGSLSSGSNVAIAKMKKGWGLSISNSTGQNATQSCPVILSLIDGENKESIVELPYSKVKAQNEMVIASATVKTEAGDKFNVTDKWYINDDDLILDRTVTVLKASGNAGFASSISLQLDKAVGWDELNFFAPGLLYGDPSYDGVTSPGGTRYNDIKHFTIREDFLPAPLYGFLQNNGYSITLLDMNPDCTTTLEETRTGLREGTLTDKKFKVGAFSSYANEGRVSIGYTMPSATIVFRGNQRGRTGQTGEEAQYGWCRRYNTVEEGFSQQYKVAFRVSSYNSFPDFTRSSYRWAWDILKPTVYWHDINQVRTCLANQLSSLVNTFDDRTGLPYIVKTKSGKVWEDANNPTAFWRAPLGFVGKHIESADQLLREGDRDKTERGKKMRQQGLAMINTALKYIPTDKPVCGGVNLMDGSHSTTNPPIWFMREATDDMVRLIEALQRERKNGIDHPDWLKWCKDFADWAITLQRQDGSFPRSFRLETSDIVEPSGTTSYNVVPLFVRLTEETNNPVYLNSAIRAAEYVWESFGKRGVFIGGAIDNPNITDKEAGLLSCEAFLYLYEATKQNKWLERAKVAADFAETWTWIWNVPMPDDAPESELCWSHDAPTIGVQGITANVAGHVDQFLDMSIPAYAKLYEYTGDRHYYDFARILMHNCKIMIALPGRMYGMIAPGFQTENFRMGADYSGRGYGTPEKWMPWVTTNHLFGINRTEEINKPLFDSLIAK